MLAFVYLFLSWLVGMVVLYLWLWNQNKDLSPKDVLVTYILSAAIGLVFAFAGYKANISFWLTWVLLAVASAFITNKFLNYKK